MIYHGNEKENHSGSHVKYYHCGKWFEGTLLEPVNYQLVNTKEHGIAVLSCHTPFYPDECDYLKAVNHVQNGIYDVHDLEILKSKIGGMSSEVKSVKIVE